ncbi:Sec-independent protein translocase subunit TatA/TatB [Paraconexibacter antarcticus]|uniref:Sec-independent protein translocase subunit TatA/TatB n=1 Tax=Paraconexibacter antarcticus TaxID=2949664 RepID=UPI002665FE81|nr:twin-arginine translocase TatA/TatE family subunit [Paraconexibacter antarcticus]
MPNIGPTELIILLVIVLVIFGPKRLPGLGKQLGDGMRDFKDAVTAKHDAADDDESERPALTRAEADDEPEATVPAPERTRREA